MGVGGRGDHHAVHAGRQDGLRRIRHLRAEPFRGPLGGLRERVGDHEGVDHREGGEGLGVERADPSEPHDADAHVLPFVSFSVVLGAGRVPFRAPAGPYVSPVRR